MPAKLASSTEITINAETLPAIVDELARTDPALAEIVRQHGYPPLWSREPGFRTLLLLILEQQVSLASARATWSRLEEAIGAPTPTSFLRLSDQELRAIGFSRQKSRYGRLLAQEIAAGRFQPETLHSLEDDETRSELLSLTGIGPWTAEIYLLMVLLRPDVWPLGDRALVVALGEIFEFDRDPSAEEIREITDRWRPWRSVAARLLWHYYLSTPRARTQR